MQGSMGRSRPARRGMCRDCSCRRSNEDGFTLVEIAIVVAILALLATIAVPKFLRFQLKSQRSEVFTNVAGIAKVQLAYYTEYESFVSCEESPGTPLNGELHEFDMNRGGWTQLGWVPDGYVRCHYEGQLYDASDNQQSDANAADWVKIVGTCDLDDDDKNAIIWEDVDPDSTSATAQHMVLRENPGTVIGTRY